MIKRITIGNDKKIINIGPRSFNSVRTSDSSNCNSSPPSSNILTAKGLVTKKGKSIAYCTAEIFDADKKLVSSGRSIFKLYDRDGNNS